MNLPALHGNWVDLVIILIAIFYLITWKRGFVLGLIDLLGFIISFLAALKLYSFFGDILVANFSLPVGIANAIGFFIAGILAEVLYSIIVNFFVSKVYAKVEQKKRENKRVEKLLKINKALGILPALGEAIVFTGFILTLIVALPIQPIVKKSVVSSKIGGPLVYKTQAVEKQLNNIFGQAVNETLTFLTINPNPAAGETVNLRFTKADVKVDKEAEVQMLEMVNRQRVQNGLNTLSLSVELQDLAREYAKDMLARGYFSHNNPEGLTPFDRMDGKNIFYQAAGENLALAPNVDLAHQGLMNSPGHRANILANEFNQVGIGVIDAGIYGEMFVQEFTD